MKKIYLIIALSFMTTIAVNAQRSAFRSGYLRAGLNTLGGDLNFSESPKENIFSGNFGAGKGYVLEMGRIFYLQDRSIVSLLNYGIDWTYFSLNYNTLDQWEDYGAANATDFYIGGEKIAAALSTKIGPAISVNLIEKVVLDARIQLAPTFRFFDLNYYENEGTANERSFSFTNDLSGADDEDYDSESISNRVGFGVQTNFGLTIRRKAIGISIDHVSGKFKNNYQAIEGGAVTFGKEKIKANNFQLKLSLTL